MAEASRLQPLHMMQARFSNADLLQSAKEQGLSTDSPDLGYVLHGHLAALFGDLAPKPFQVIDRRSGVTVLGYGSADQQALEERLDFAEPLAARSLFDLATKPMRTQWTTGRRLGFEVRVIPTVRIGNRERDAYLSLVGRLEKNEEAGHREPIYRQWLERQLAPAAKVESCGMDRFRLTRLFRRGARGEKGRSVGRPRFPDAVFKGTLVVENSDAFARLLTRGVGRHRAFGFGMLLLRPPSRP